MNRIAILALAVLTLGIATTAEAHWKFPWNRGNDPLKALFDPNQGIPILDPADLATTHVILTPAIAAGAGVKIKALDNCVVAFLAHPEYLTSTGMAPATPAVTVNPVGPISAVALELVRADSITRSLQKKAALFAAPLPDDITLACAPLEISAGGIVHSLQSFLHPAAAAPVKP